MRQTCPLDFSRIRIVLWMIIEKSGMTKIVRGLYWNKFGIINEHISIAIPMIKNRTAF